MPGTWQAREALLWAECTEDYQPPPPTPSFWGSAVLSWPAGAEPEREAGFPFGRAQPGLSFSGQLACSWNGPPLVLAHGFRLLGNPGPSHRAGLGLGLGQGRGAGQHCPGARAAHELSARSSGPFRVTCRQPAVHCRPRRRGRLSHSRRQAWAPRNTGNTALRSPEQGGYPVSCPHLPPGHQLSTQKQQLPRSSRPVTSRPASPAGAICTQSRSAHLQGGEATGEREPAPGPAVAGWRPVAAGSAPWASSSGTSTGNEAFTREAITPVP